MLYSVLIVQLSFNYTIFVFQNDIGVTNNMTTDITTVPSERPQTKDKEDIMSVLLAHERRGGSSAAAASAVNSVVQGAASGSDSSGDEQPDMTNDSGNCI